MSIIAIETITTLSLSYVLLLVLQASVWSIIKSLFVALPDEGWSLGRIGGIIIISCIIWQLGYLGLPVNNTNFVRILCCLMLLISGFILFKKGLSWALPNKKAVKLIILEEYLFIVGFGLIGLVRSYLPHIDSLEKFMDYGFVVRYLNSPSLPAIDMWQAGSAINYYSFGHFWASILIRILSVAPEIGYNLVLAFIAGTSLASSFLLCTILSAENKNRDYVLIGSLLGSVIVVFGSNTHLLWYLFKHLSLSGYWYADATRFIYNTIHEFPGYSFVVSDLHGHLLDLPISLVFLTVAYLFITKRRIFEAFILGILLSVMMMTNTWDVPIYGMFLGIWMMLALFYEKISFKTGLLFFVVLLLTAMLMSWLWLNSFVPISNGIALVTKKSPVWQLLVLWSGAIIINILAWIYSKDKESKITIRSLVITTTLLVLIPEFIYAKDIYPDHPRANTMFKLTYQASIMVGIVFGVLLNWITAKLTSKHFFGNLMIFIFCLVLFVGLIIFPTVAFPAFYANFKVQYGLNGEGWLIDSYPTKYKFIQYLKANRNGKNMVEAVGDSYTHFNAISVFSGTPTIQGWRVHEWLWRGGYDKVLIKEKEVSAIYEGFDSETTSHLISRYNVGWIVVGDDEESMYLVNHQKIQSLGEIVLRDGGSYLLKVK